MEELIKNSAFKESLFSMYWDALPVTTTQVDTNINS